MPRDLDALLDAVVDEQTFIQFVDALASDFAEEREIESKTPSAPYGAGSLGWENGTVDAVLEAAAAWGASTCKNPKYSAPSQNPWHRCAQILYAGKVCE